MDNDMTNSTYKELEKHLHILGVKITWVGLAARIDIWLWTSSQLFLEGEHNSVETADF